MVTEKPPNNTLKMLAAIANGEMGRNPSARQPPPKRAGPKIQATRTSDSSVKPVAMSAGGRHVAPAPARAGRVGRRGDGCFGRRRRGRPASHRLAATKG